jgi:hypothetical protein
MTIETLLVLLFTVFAVPGACFLTLVGIFLRGLYKGWKWDRDYRRNVLDMRARRVA